MPLGWLTSEYLHPGSTIKSTSSHTGNFSVNLIGGDTVAFILTTTLVRPGSSYLFSGWVKTENLLPGSFNLQFLNILASPIGASILIPVYRSTNYRQYSRWLTAPESAFFIVVGLTTLPDNSLFVDDVTLEDTSLNKIEERKAPFLSSNHSDLFQFFLPYPQRVEMRVYNLLGEEIRRVDFGILPSGFYRFSWNGRDGYGREVRPGLYFIQILTEEKGWVRKVVKIGQRINFPDF